MIQTAAGPSWGMSGLKAAAAKPAAKPSAAAAAAAPRKIVLEHKAGPRQKAAPQKIVLEHKAAPRQKAAAAAAASSSSESVVRPRRAYQDPYPLWRDGPPPKKRCS